MNPCVFMIFSLFLLVFVPTSSSKLVAVGRGNDNGVLNKCSDKERHALLHFKAPLQDLNDTLSTWRDDKHDCCNWHGVTCNKETGHVIELDIFGCNLVGEISHSLLNLSHLKHLDLSLNAFYGTIPMSIGSLTRLRYLGLGNNDLNGTIPPSIASLAQLIFLDLSYNSLYGTIPSEFGNLTSLKVLSLGDIGRCRVGNIEWLSQLSHLETLEMDGISLANANHWVDTILSLQSLSRLSLQGCELSRVMYPYSSLLNSSSSIDTLSLGNNSLTSSMYNWLFPLTSNKLRFLSLDSNMLDGIPRYLGNLCSLESFFFYSNSAAVKFPEFLKNLSGCTSLTLLELYAPDNQFTGSLSDEIQNFSSLKYLFLSHSHFNGTISEKLWELPKLRTLELSFNNLTVPSTYHLSGLSYLHYIDMRSCTVGPHFHRWIHILKNLSYLDLSNTRISDTIPLEFWDMLPSQLQHLNLSSNNITGKVPDLLSSFANVSIIDMSSNNFYGPILNVPSSLSSLNLSRNKFSGGISFICQIVRGILSFLDLSHNLLIGQLPDCLWHFKELTVLNLGHNNLFGRLPPSIGSLIQLKVLYLYKNNFSGELPLSIKYCTHLISLNLGGNMFSGNVPVSIGKNLSGLYVLILRSNNFFGTIPSELCQLANLQILDLSMNNLHGTIPSCLSNLTSMVQHGFSQDVQYYKIRRNANTVEQGTYVDHAMIEWQGDEREFFKNLGLLKSIDLSSNNLVGQIPYGITDLHDLIVLNLSKNTLFGDIPQTIGEMKNLETLDLSGNSFSGRIPSSMPQMNFLNYLDMSCNNLSGRIPLSTQLQSFQPSRYDGNTRLCGRPLAKSCPGDEESKVPSLSGKSEGDGEGVDELQMWFYIGGGIGFATGFWIACGALLFNVVEDMRFFQFYDSFRDWIYVKVMVFIANLQKARHT